MDVREATPADQSGVSEVARRSLEASYGHVLSQEVIDRAVAEWYGDAFQDDVSASDTLYLVAVDGDDVAGFSQSYLVGQDGDIGEVAWLHVDPEFRGTGVGADLIEATESTLADRGVAEIVGRVLAANEAGAEFYVTHEYEAGEDREVTIGEETHVERTFVKGADRSAAAVPMAPVELDDGREVYVAYDESDRASKAPFYTTYLDEEREERYGWFCSNCESVDVAMDAMGRAKCSNCGNERKPTRWDASY